MDGRNKLISQGLVEELRRDGYVVLPACANEDILGVMAPLCFQAPNGS